MASSATTELHHVEDIEFTRSFRFERPLSLVVFDLGSGRHGRRPFRRRPASRLHALAALVSQHVRSYDRVIADPRVGRIVIVAPEAASKGADRIHDRLLRTIAQDGWHGRGGTATFPEDGTSVMQLLSGATERISARTVTGDIAHRIHEVRS